MGCHFLLQGIFDSGIEPASLRSPALAGRFFYRIEMGERVEEVKTIILQTSSGMANLKEECVRSVLIRGSEFPEVGHYV